MAPVKLTVVIRWALRGAFVLMLLFSMALNGAALIGGSLYALASNVYETATGAKSLISRHSDDVAVLQTELVTERRIKRELRGEVAELGSELTSQRALNSQIREHLGDGLVSFRGSRVPLGEAVTDTADRVSSRVQKSAAREVGSMAGEALPYVGIAVILGVTALELNDLCQTMLDMDELKRAFDPSLAPSEGQRTVCAYEVPSREELVAATREAPGRAWNAARESVPTLEDVRAIDWSGYMEATQEGAGAFWSDTKVGAAGVLDWTAGEAANAWRGLTGLFADDDEVEEGDGPAEE